VAASGTTTVELRGAATDPGWAHVTIYVPSGYTINLGQSVGARIGTVVAQSPGATGTVLGADPLDAAVRQAALECTGTAAHAGAWLLRFSTFDVPVFVDPTSLGESGFGSATLRFCLSAAQRLTDLKIALSAGVFTNPLLAGLFVWRALVTPWRADGSSSDPTSTAEAEGIVGIPASLSLKARVNASRRGKRVTSSVLLSGTLLENLRGVAGAKVSFFGNDRSAGSATTGATGAFARKRKLEQRTSFTATASVPTRDLPCVAPLPVTLAPGGCVSATRSGYRLRSNSVLVAPRAR
jgi:hypothetical protein